MVNERALIIAGIMILASPIAIKQTNIENIVEESIEEYTSAIKDFKAMERYIREKRNKEPIAVYKVMLTEYLDILKVLKEGEKIRKCKEDLAKEYPFVMKELNKKIGESKDITYINGLIYLRDELKQKAREEGIRTY